MESFFLKINPNMGWVRIILSFQNGIKKVFIFLIQKIHIFWILIVISSKISTGCTFSEREIDYSRISNGSELGKLNMAREFNLAYFSNNLQVHSDFMFLGYGEGIYSKMAIWDKKSQIAYPIKNIENDLTIIPGINSIGISVELSSQPGYHLFMIDAPMLLDILEEVETKDNSYLERLRALNIQRDDNPVLLFFSIQRKGRVRFSIGHINVFLFPPQLQHRNLWPNSHSSRKGQKIQNPD